MENKEMTLNEYQKKAMTTCMPSCNNFSYMLTEIMSEYGEFVGKIAKAIRKEEIEIDKNVLYTGNKVCYPAQLTEDLQKELGDTLWGIAGMCHVMGWNLEDIAQQNIDKLASRAKRGVIDGNGDNR